MSCMFAQLPLNNLQIKRQTIFLENNKPDVCPGTCADATHNLINS